MDFILELFQQKNNAFFLTLYKLPHKLQSPRNGNTSLKWLQYSQLAPSLVTLLTILSKCVIQIYATAQL